MNLNAERIGALVRGVTEEQGRFKPDPETWSILETVNHLYDEEREDFRVRLRVVLEHPEQDFPPIAPAAWVTDRAYNGRDLAQSLMGFLTERAISLRWLRSLGSANWDAAKDDSGRQTRAGDLLAAWAMHDILHMRQLVELQRAWLLTASEPYDWHYAGEW
jgi:hypothetical protein